MEASRADDLIERARTGSTRPGPARLVLAIGMVVSAILALTLGSHASFTVDEYSWISLSADFSLGEAFDAYVGHLIAIPKLIYWIVLELIGIPGYAVFQLLTLASLFLMVGLLFAFLRKRVPDFVALAPCLVLLVFPVDHLHYLTGNGIAISLALAFGIAALLAWDRGSRSGDWWAFAFLILGICTYTVAVPFAIGLLAVAIFRSEDRRRAWVPAIPLVAYAIWRVVAASGGVESETGSTDWANLFLLPAWTFQSLGAVLAALTGLGFDFSNVAGGPASEQGRLVGPAFAVAALLALAWRVRLGRMPIGFWVVGAALLALFASQVLVWGTLDARDPGAPRYLLPGAVLVVMVAFEAARGLGWTRAAFSGLWIVAAASLLISIGILARNTEWLETVELGAKAEITAVQILAGSTKEPLPPTEQPRDRIRSEFDPAKAAAYGNLGFSEVGLASQPGWVGKRVDDFLAESLRLGLNPLRPGTVPTGCRPAEPGRFAPYSTKLRLSGSGAVLRATGELDLTLGRYGGWASVELGPMAPGAVRKLWLPDDGGTTDWFIQATPEGSGSLADLEICDFS